METLIIRFQSGRDDVAEFPKRWSHSQSGVTVRGRLWMCGSWELRQYACALQLWPGWDWWPLKTAWSRHQMVSALLALCAENSPVTDEFPSQRPVTRSFDFFLWSVLDKRETGGLRRHRAHYNVIVMPRIVIPDSVNCAVLGANADCHNVIIYFL